MCHTESSAVKHAFTAPAAIQAAFAAPPQRFPCRARRASYRGAHGRIPPGKMTGPRMAFPKTRTEAFRRPAAHAVARAALVGGLGLALVACGGRGRPDIEVAAASVTSIG